MPRAQKKILKNAKALKVISTSVPPETYKALKTLVTDEYTMSHVLRDLIQKSDLMRGGLPNHHSSHDLANTVVSLKEEIAQLRKDMQAMSLAALPATSREPAQLIRTYAIDTVKEPQSIPESPDFDDLELDEWCQNIIQEVIDEDLPMESSDEKAREQGEYMSAQIEDESLEQVQNEPPQESKRDGKTLLGRLTAMLGVARKTA